MTLHTPLSLRLYAGAMKLFAAFLPGVLTRRAAQGKEDPARIAERLGTASGNRPDGTLIWLHGASVGESLVALSLADALRNVRPGLLFLFTSGTKTSADLVAKRLQDGDLHRYVPVDTPSAVKGFLAAWRPDLAIFIEGEIWPNLLQAAHAAAIPMALVNARMTAKSIRGWSKQRAAAAYLFDLFDVVLPADQATKDGLTLFRSKPIGPAGNLKLAAAAPKFDLAEAAKLKQKIGQRMIWLAASTHDGEEALMVGAHTSLQLGARDALLILAPRHPERAADVEFECRKAGFTPVRRSLGQVPGPQDSVWLWDTLGELGLVMHLAPVTFVGGSLRTGIGGHNPVEPVALGSAVVSGSLVSSFLDLYQDLENADGAKIIDDPTPDRIALAVATLLGDDDLRTAQILAAKAVVARGAGAMETTVTHLLHLLDRQSP